MPDLIGINGFKTSGKDTTQGFIRELLYPGFAVERAAFADKLKIMAARALGFNGPDEYLIELMDGFKENGNITVEKYGGSVARIITGREYLQWFGANAREVFGDTFWVNQVLPREKADLAGSYPNADIVCITDVRYPNEAERVKALGGTVLEVVRPGLVSDGHSSETPLPRELVDYQIINDGDLDDLRRKTDAFLLDRLNV